MIRATKQRVLALVIAFVFCFVQQAAELHHASAHGIRAGHTAFAAAAAPSLSPNTSRNAADNCALCAFEATLLRPAASPQRLLTLPIAFALPPSRIAASAAAAAPDFPFAASSPRAPPFSI